MKTIFTEIKDIFEQLEATESTVILEYGLNSVFVTVRNGGNEINKQLENETNQEFVASRGGKIKFTTTLEELNKLWEVSTLKCLPDNRFTPIEGPTWDYAQDEMNNDTVLKIGDKSSKLISNLDSVGTISLKGNTLIVANNDCSTILRLDVWRN